MLFTSWTMRESILPTAFTLPETSSMIQMAFSGALEFSINPPISPVKNLKVPSCCPIKKILMTMPTMIPMLLGLSYLINFKAVVTMGLLDFYFTLHLGIDQQGFRCFEGSFEQAHPAVARFP